MNKLSFLLCAALLPCTATESAMNSALDSWQTRINEYRAALEQAPTDEAKAAVNIPDGLDIAPAIWQSVCGVTDSKQQEYGDKSGKKLITVRSYEFQKPWAAPAVIWLLTHPVAFDAAMGNAKPKQKAAFAKAVHRSLSDTHYNSPAVADYCAVLALGTSVDEYELLEKIYTRNKDNNARACAAMGMSLMLANPMVSGIAGSEVVARAKRLYYLKQALTLAAPDARFGDHSLNEVAEEQAYRLRCLSIGCVPPQVKVLDAAGKEQSFPTPGKRHLLFFWSPKDDNGTEIANYLPELRKRHPQLCIVPIAPYAEGEERAESGQLSDGSPVYTDNQEGSAGRTYRLSAVPYVVLLDEQCRILYIGFPDLRLQSALDKIATAAPEKTEGSIAITEKAPETQQEASAPAPPKHPEQPTEGEGAPALRDMPNF